MAESMTEFAAAETIPVPKKPRVPRIPNPFAAIRSRFGTNDSLVETAVGKAEEETVSPAPEPTSTLSEFDQVRSFFTEAQGESLPESQNWSSVMDDLEGSGAIAKLGQKDGETGQDLRTFVLRHRNIIPGKGSYGSGEVEWIVLTKDGPRAVRDGTSLMTDAIASAVRNPDKFAKNAGYDGHFIRLGEKGHTVKIEEEIPGLEVVGATIRASIEDAQNEELYGGAKPLQKADSGLTREENSDTLKVAMTNEGQGHPPKSEDFGTIPSPTIDNNAQAGLPSEFLSPILGAGATSEDQPKTLKEASNMLNATGSGLIDRFIASRETQGEYCADFGFDGRTEAGADGRIIAFPEPYQIDGDREPGRFLILTRDGPKEIRPKDVKGFRDVILQRIKKPNRIRPSLENYNNSGELSFSMMNEPGTSYSVIKFGGESKDFGEVTDLDLTEAETTERVQRVIQENIAASEAPVEKAIAQDESMKSLGNFVQNLHPRT